MHTLKKVIHIVLGLVLVIIGVAGLILPLIHGILFLLVGLILLSFESPYVEQTLSRLAKKNKKLDDWYIRASRYVQKVFK